jgi:hypothetical protein
MHADFPKWQKLADIKRAEPNRIIAVARVGSHPLCSFFVRSHTFIHFFIGDLYYMLSGRVYLEKIWNFELVAWDVMTVSEMADERVKLEHS